MRFRRKIGEGKLSEIRGRSEERLHHKQLISSKVEAITQEKQICSQYQQAANILYKFFTLDQTKTPTNPQLKRQFKHGTLLYSILQF